MRLVHQGCLALVRSMFAALWPRVGVTFKVSGRRAGRPGSARHGAIGEMNMWALGEGHGTPINFSVRPNKGNESSSLWSSLRCQFWVHGMSTYKILQGAA